MTPSPQQPIEDIFDQALSRLRRGESMAEVISAYPEYREELAGLLETAALGSDIPRNIVPTPLRRHKFAEKAYQSWWLSTVNLMKFGAVPLSLVFILLGAKTLVAKTESSLPKQHLYSLKRASEQLQLTFTRNADDQAAFQLQLTQRRLDEVKQAAAGNNPDLEAAALAELKDQSQKTFDTVPQVAAAKAITSKDSTLLDSLVAINKQQQEVLTSIQPQPETKDLTATALDTAKEHGLALAALVATVQEQTLADLKTPAIGDAAATTVAPDKTADKAKPAKSAVEKTAKPAAVPDNDTPPVEDQNQVTAGVIISPPTTPQ